MLALRYQDGQRSREPITCYKNTTISEDTTSYSIPQPLLLYVTGFTVSAFLFSMLVLCIYTGPGRNKQKSKCLCRCYPHYGHKVLPSILFGPHTAHSSQDTYTPGVALERCKYIPTSLLNASCIGHTSQSIS